MEKEEEKSLTESIFDLKKLIKGLHSLKTLQIIEDTKRFFLYSFLSGVVRGVGFTIGVTVVAALIFWILSKLTIVPLLGNWIIDLLDYIQQAKFRAF